MLTRFRHSLSTSELTRVTCTSGCPHDCTSATLRMSVNDIERRDALRVLGGMTSLRALRGVLDVGVRAPAGP